MRLNEFTACAGLGTFCNSPVGGLVKATFTAGGELDRRKKKKKRGKAQQVVEGFEERDPPWVRKYNRDFARAMTKILNRKDSGIPEYEQAVNRGLGKIGKPHVRDAAKLTLKQKAKKTVESAIQELGNPPPVGDKAFLRRVGFQHVHGPKPRYLNSPQPRPPAPPPEASAQPGPGNEETWMFRVPNEFADDAATLLAARQSPCEQVVDLPGHWEFHWPDQDSFNRAFNLVSQAFQPVIKEGGFQFPEWGTDFNKPL